MTDQTPTPPVIDPTKSYEVVLKRTIEWPIGSGFHFRPRDHHVMYGAVCLEIVDAIASAKQV